MYVIKLDGALSYTYNFWVENNPLKYKGGGKPEVICYHLVAS